MKISCRKCSPNEVFEIPNFSLAEKKLLLEALNVSGLEAIKEMRKLHRITLRNAKFVMTHINIEHKKCNRCAYQLNILEYTSCANCDALNLNWNV
ncbi:hypothetical protein [Kordia sp.]|uniref:hypothetical protein n=1 Tax=Kordia sp. TaxID=1965332 RepID=UPI003D2D1892